MKRDLHLIRDLLLIIENADAPHPQPSWGINSSLPRVQHHLRLMVEAGFVRAVGEAADGAISVRLTWSGYEFLELVRDELTWQRVQRHVVRKTKGLNVAVLKKVLFEQAEQSAGQSDRIKIDETARTRTLANVASAGVSRATDATAGNGSTGSPKTKRPSIAEFSNRRSEIPSIPAPLDAQFQFHVWNGEAESLPVHLL